MPKEQTQTAAAMQARDQSGSPGSMPQLTWQLPKGWEEAAPGQMRLASFRVKGKEGEPADVGIFPLPGMAGSDLDNVNRWRGQVGQPPVSEEELNKSAESIPVDGLTAKLYEQAGENAGSGEKTRILAGILRREGVAWFFKMTGQDGLVAEQKPAFVQFLKSMKFSAPTSAGLPPDHPPVSMGQAMAGSAGPAASAEGKPKWRIPEGWKEAPAGQFLVAKFSVPGAEIAKASVNVSMSVGEGGGVVGNVNRWRGQLGLAQSPADEINQSLQAVEVEGGKGSLVDITGADARTGEKARLVGVIVPRDGRTWFYKLMGPAEIVEQQKKSFTTFVQSAEYPHVH